MKQRFINTQRKGRISMEEHFKGHTLTLKRFQDIAGPSHFSKIESMYKHSLDFCLSFNPINSDRYQKINDRNEVHAVSSSRKSEL